MPPTQLSCAKRSMLKVAVMVWELEAASRFSSLAYWFGGYSLSTFSRIRSIFTAMTEHYEIGVPGALHRNPIRYACWGGCVADTWARKSNKRTIQICPQFMARNAHEQVWTLVHEALHGVDSGATPQDRCNPQICFAGWRSCTAAGIPQQCYQDNGNLVASWNFITIEDPGVRLWNYPRLLVEAGEGKDFRNNVDNYVSWAVARWADAQWRECNGPNLTTHPLTGHPPLAPGPP